jgi:hypothetical protein
MDPPESQFGTYDHRIMRARLPVRSAIFKHDTGRLVVKWVTISESLLLYVFLIFFFTEILNKDEGREERRSEQGDGTWKYF